MQFSTLWISTFECSFSIEFGVKANVYFCIGLAQKYNELPALGEGVYVCGVNPFLSRFFLRQDSIDASKEMPAGRVGAEWQVRLLSERENTVR